MAETLYETHVKGDLHSSIELESTGRPITVMFGHHDTLAKSFGEPLEMKDLQVANNNVTFVR